ncbi:MAG TPA: metalloregulator ArsR/SmtB family transcription factor [Polyangiaceae bacterium]|nr:metalloregulator ArsR/SmtB family transcription factor [Polyangiaceae bacterium]
MSTAVATDARWHLYRLLADPSRLKLLALASEAELSVGELAELSDQTQPNVSRQAAPLRQAGLLTDRRDGTRTFLRLAEGASSDPVVADALREGLRLVDADGSRARVRDVVRARDDKTREYFATAHTDADVEASDLGAYLFALGLLLPRRGMAVDAGTGDGAILEAIAPLFERVIAVDRSERRLGHARARMRLRGYDHVEFVCGEVDSPEMRRKAQGSADVVVAGRMLHHSPVPGETVAALSALLAPGGRLLVVDYGPHGDESFREAEADVWSGFEPRELAEFAQSSGLAGVRVVEIPPGCWPALVKGKGSPSRVPWLALVAEKPRGERDREPQVRAGKARD